MKTVSRSDKPYSLTLAVESTRNSPKPPGKEAARRIVECDFRDYRRDRFVDAQTSTSARLAPTLLLTNEMGVSREISDECR